MPLPKHKNIVWLASYPKSGNTWFRVLLTNILQLSDKPADINQLITSTIASNREVFEHATGLSSSDLTNEEIYQWQPDVFKHMAKNASETIYVKIHDGNYNLPNGQPLIPAEATKAVVYLIRNPLDVAISFAHHMNKPVQRAIDALNNPQFAFCMNHAAMQIQLKQQLGNWSSHVKSYLHSDLPTHFIKYEQLLQNTFDTFKATLNFLNIEASGADIEKAIKFSNFDMLKQQESKAGFKEKSPKADSFFRKGQSGEWKNCLTPTQVRSVFQNHGEVMKQFGYWDDEDYKKYTA